MSGRSNEALVSGDAVRTSLCCAVRRWPRWTSRRWRRCIQVSSAGPTASRSRQAPAGPSISAAEPLTNGTSGYTGRLGRVVFIYRPVELNCCFVFIMRGWRTDHHSGYRTRRSRFTAQFLGHEVSDTFDLNSAKLEHSSR